MNVCVKQERRKSLAMRVIPRGVQVFIPHDLDAADPQVKTFIQHGLAQLSPPDPNPAKDRLDREALLALVAEWAQRIGVEVKRVQVRRMRQKWGSVSTAGNLTLAEDLLELPQRLAEYVVVHELLHLQVPHHNALYRLLLLRYLPDWRQRERDLGSWGPRQVPSSP